MVGWDFPQALPRAKVNSDRTRGQSPSGVQGSGQSVYSTVKGKVGCSECGTTTAAYPMESTYEVCLS